MTEIPYQTWGSSYMICGGACIGIGIFYCFNIYKDLRSLTPKLPGYKISQILFILAVFLRGIGWFIYSIFYFTKSQNLIEVLSPILIGLPGYAITISYVYLFYLWSSICVNLIANDSTTGFNRKFKISVNVSLAIIVISGSALVIITIYHMIMIKDNYIIIHIIEGVTATIRDFVIATIILFSTRNLIQMSEKPLFSLRYNESIYCWMLICILSALYIRGLSIILFIFILDKNWNGFLTDYLNTFITALISEIYPCFMILFNRKRSGLLSVYDIIE